MDAVVLGLLVLFHFGGLQGLFEGFAGVAILVKTLSGMMQMARTSSEDGQVYRPFDDEREAQAFLEERLRMA